MRGPPWAGGDKPKELAPTLKKIFTYVGRLKWYIYVGVALSLVSSVLALIGPQYLMEITNIIERGIGGSMDMDAIVPLCVILLALYLASLALSVGEHYIIQRASMIIAYKFRKDLIRKVDRLPLGYYDSTSTGDLMSRLTNDTDTVGENFGQSISMLLTSVTTLIGALVMMLYTNVTLTLFACIPVFIAFVLMRILIRRSQKYFRGLSRGLGAVNGTVEETYYGMDIVRAYNGAPALKERFEVYNHGLLTDVFMSRFFAGMMPRMMSFFNNLGYVTVCIIGAYLINEEQIGFGVVVAFIVYVRQFTQPVSQIADSLSNLQSVGASGERILEILDAEEMSDESACEAHLGRSEGGVEFRDVDFSYIPGREVIHGFSLKVEPGTRVAIVGPTGAGKTTLANLLMRFYDPDSGEILIDGVSTRTVTRGEVHDQFSMVLQDSWIFRGTVRENVVYTTENVTDEKVWEALRAVGIDAFVEKLGGLDAVLKDTDTMSAGQKQQISIARAMIKDAPMIILDEATSSVDTRTEARIQKAMDALTHGRTSFIIAHRLTTIRTADVILVMRDGSVVESGTHESLLASDGFYAELYRSQFRNCE